jgi:hypothetical protein
MKNKIIACITLAIFLFSMIGSPTVCAIDDTYELPFGLYNDERDYWETNPGNMVNQNENSYANTTIVDDSQFIMTSIMLDDLGTITKVELRAKAYWTGATRDIILRPYFSGEYPGDLHVIDDVPQSSGGWSNWTDITTDTNAHSFWDWTDVEDLCCLVTVGDGSSGFNLWCSQVEIRVTYTPD